MNTRIFDLPVPMALNDTSNANMKTEGCGGLSC